MSYRKVLRRLADCQQFAELKSATLNYLAETADLQVLPLLALAHGHLDEFAQSVELCKEIETQIAQLDLDARVDLAALYCLLQRLDEAISLLESAQLEAPEHPLVLARLAWCRLAEGKNSAARALYQRAAELAPQRLPLWSALSQLALQESDYAGAQQALDKAISRLETVHVELPEPLVQQFTAQLRSLQLEIWLATDKQGRAEQWLNERRETIAETQWVALLIGYAGLLAGQDKHASADQALREAVKHYPQNIGLISQLAELAQLQGRTQQAMQLLRRAIHLAEQQDKPQAALWVRLSTACLHHLPERARHAAEQAWALLEEMAESGETPPEQISQLRLQAKNALAQVESQAQNFALAESLFNEVLAENPHFLAALQGLGQQQMQQGKIEQAVALFERIKAIDPATGYSALINARQFPEDPGTLERMEQAARQPSLQGSVRSGLLLQLASAWEKRKAYDKAFALAKEANAASKQLLDYDGRAHRNSCARIRFAFCKALYEHRQDCGVDSTLPVYVLGMPRSGTTLVEQILAGHSDIFGAGELGVIPSRIQGLNRWERHVGSGRSYPDCVDDLSPYVTEGIANGILEELRELAAEDKPDAKHVVDKLPHNFENIGLIKFFFPNAKIISVRRDPRDIAISNYFTDYQAKHGGMGFAYDLTDIGEQLADHNLMMHHWHQLFPGEILEINYEDVLEDLQGSARKMLDYIGVDWQPEVLKFNELDRAVKTASVWQVRQPIYKTSKAKWKRYEKFLAPLIKGTNAKILSDPINDMLTLPLPGFLSEGVARYKSGDLDGAELNFKKMLHHNPDHAACHYMLGLVYLSKNHHSEGIMQLEKALQITPWHKEWVENLHKAYQLVGDTEQAQALADKYKLNEAEHKQQDNQYEQYQDESWLAQLS